MSGTKFLYVCVLLLIVQGDVLGAFDPVAVKAKIDALKTQMATVAQARTAASTAKESLDATLASYQQYSENSTVVTKALDLAAKFTELDAPYEPLANYSDTTFGPAYRAYFAVNAKRMAAEITNAMNALKATANTINSLIAARTTAQNFFEDVVSGVAKPAFLGP